MTLDYFYGQTGELFSFYRIPKALFQEQRFQSLSTDAKTLYGILLDRMSIRYVRWCCRWHCALAWQLLLLPMTANLWRKWNSLS